MAVQLRINEDLYLCLELLRNMKFDLKQNIMNCGLVPSLEYISITKVAIHLWQHGIREELRQFLFVSGRTSSDCLHLNDILEMFGKKVLENASCLTLPTYFKDIVKESINIIRDELKFFFENQYLIFFTCQKSREKLLIYWENICWTQECRINKLKTAERIIENGNLSINDQYILACNNCLKEKIQELYKKLQCTITEIIKENYEEYEFKDPESFQLVRFWSAFFGGSNKSCKGRKSINIDTIAGYLTWATECKEDVAFQYFFENFAAEVEKKYYIDLIDLEFDFSHTFTNYCMLYLYNQRRRFELQDLLRVEMSNFVVTTLYRISRYYKVLLVPAYVNEFIKVHNVHNSLQLLSIIWKKCFHDLNSFMRIWEKFSLHFENDIKRNFTDIGNQALYQFNEPERDFQPLKYLLKTGTFSNKIDILLGSENRCICVELLFKSLDSFEHFINDIFDSEKEISLFKALLLAHPKFNSIYYDSSLENNYEYFETILATFISLDETNRYKNKLPYKNNADIIYYICIKRDEVDLLSALDKFISWCFEEDKDKIVRCKARIFDLETTSYIEAKEQFFRCIGHLIHKTTWGNTNKNTWELVEKYWKWIFFATKDKINTPAKKLNRIKKILYFRSEESFCEYLDMFITSCFEQNEIDELKKELMVSNSLLTFVEDIIAKDPPNNYLKAENLLDWCHSSDKDAINTFKNKLLRILGIKILLKLIKFFNYEYAVTRLFEWFKPSAETAMLFEKKVINYIKQKKSLTLEKLNLKLWNEEKVRLNKSLKILANISKENHINKKARKEVDKITTKRLDKVATKRLNEEASGPKIKKVGCPKPKKRIQCVGKKK